MERDVINRAVPKIKCISTHTLTWSVTSQCVQLLLGLLISTHTLTWSVTEGTLITYIEEDISTHTLTWSVTAVKSS